MKVGPLFQLQNVFQADIISSGTIETLRNHKANITEATKGIECGMAFENWEDLREGDSIQVFQDIEKPRTL